jgi:hypothetical protein
MAMEFLYRDGDIPIDAIDKRLFLGLEKGLEEFPLGDFWAVVARRIFQKLLPALKKQEVDLRVQGFSPYMVEKNMKVLINGLGLKGKVDRVDKRGVKVVKEQPAAGNGHYNSVILLITVSSFWIIRRVLRIKRVFSFPSMHVCGRRCIMIRLRSRGFIY